MKYFSLSWCSTNAHFLTIVYRERHMILSPDAAMTLVFQTVTRKILGIAVGYWEKHPDSISEGT